MRTSGVKKNALFGAGYGLFLTGALIFLAFHAEYFFPVMRVAGCLAIPVLILGFRRRNTWAIAFGATLGIGLLFLGIEAFMVYRDLSSAPIDVSYEKVMSGLEGELNQEYLDGNEALFGVMVRHRSGQSRGLAVTETPKGVVRAAMTFYLKEKKQIDGNDMDIAARFLRNAVPGFGSQEDLAQVAAGVGKVMENMNASTTLKRSGRDITIRGVISSKNKGKTKRLDGIGIVVSAGKAA